MPLDPTYWLAEQIKALRNQVQSLSLLPAIYNASSNGSTGWLKIFAEAISGRPALEFHYTGGGGDLLAQMYQDTGGNMRITGGLQVSGTKNFVMSHPTKDGWVLRHASTESPVNGVEYWGESYVEPSGKVRVRLPEYFEALTKDYNRNVQLTAINVPADLAASRVANGGFTVVGPPGAEFAWVVKAERATQPGDWPIDFLAEESGHLPPPPAVVPEEPPSRPEKVRPKTKAEAKIDREIARAIAAAENEGMPDPKNRAPRVPTSSPMVEVSWENRPDRPAKPARTP